MKKSNLENNNLKSDSLENSKLKDNIKILVKLLIFALIVFILISNILNGVKFFKFYLTKIKNTNTKISFAFPYVNKSITNDTFFTIAIGNNILKNGITNVDTLTWHQNLKFPHSRNI